MTEKNLESVVAHAQEAFVEAGQYEGGSYELEGTFPVEDISDVRAVVLSEADQPLMEGSAPDEAFVEIGEYDPGADSYDFEGTFDIEVIDGRHVIVIGQLT